MCQKITKGESQPRLSTDRSLHLCIQHKEQPFCVCFVFTFFYVRYFLKFFIFGKNCAAGVTLSQHSGS